MAIGTVFFFGTGGKERLVLFGVDLVLGVTTHAERIDFQPGIHNVRRCAVAARGPGFVGNVLVRLAMATRASDIGTRMSYGNILLHVVYVTDETAAVIRSRFALSICLGLLVNLLLLAADPHDNRYCKYKYE